MSSSIPAKHTSEPQRGSAVIFVNHSVRPLCSILRCQCVGHRWSLFVLLSLCFFFFLRSLLEEELLLLLLELEGASVVFLDDVRARFVPVAWVSVALNFLTRKHLGYYYMITLSTIKPYSGISASTQIGMRLSNRTCTSIWLRRATGNPSECVEHTYTQILAMPLCCAHGPLVVPGWRMHLSRAQGWRSQDRCVRILDDHQTCGRVFSQSSICEVGQPKLSQAFFGKNSPLFSYLVSWVVCFFWMSSIEARALRLVS